MADANISDSLAQSAIGPKEAAHEGERAVAHSLPDQIEADRYLAAKGMRGDGIKRIKLIPPSACGVNLGRRGGC